MYGDVEVVRRRAAQLREQATDVRALAERLTAQADALDWQGRAADAMRTRVRDRAEHLRQAAHAHDSAADALDRHGAETARTKDAIAESEAAVTTRVGEARERVARVAAHQDPAGVRREASPDDLRLAAFVAPPSGHKAWLAVDPPAGPTGRADAHR